MKNKEGKFSLVCKLFFCIKNVRLLKVALLTGLKFIFDWSEILILILISSGKGNYEDITVTVD